MKKITKHVSLLLIVFMLCTMLCPIFALAEGEGENTTPAEGQIAVLLGDANGDNAVNTADATVILKHCANLAIITDNIRLIAADVDKNGTVNTGDATQILRMVAFGTEPETIYVNDPNLPNPSDEPVNPTDEPVNPTDEPVNPTDEPVNPTDEPVNPSAEPTDDPTAEPTDDPTAEPTDDPTAEPTEEPTEEPTQAPTDNIYFYGNTYFGSDMNLIYSEGSIPVNSRPVSTFRADSEANGVIGMDYTLPDGITKITRTFRATGMATRVNNVEYYQVEETTDWSKVNNVILIEKTAGATVSGSVSLATLSGSSSENYMGTESSRKQLLLIEDIDWNSYWVAMGGGANFYKFFYSHFDGLGYAINGITVRQSLNGSDSDYVAVAGFIGKADGGSIKNLSLPNADVRGTVPGTNAYMSLGIVAAMAHNVTIANCHTSGYAELPNSPWGCGGIVGYTQTRYNQYGQGGVRVSGCSSTAMIINDRSATAGIIGKAIGQEIYVDQCWYMGDIYSASTNVGGIIGWSSQNMSKYVTNCWTAGRYFGGRTNDDTPQIGGICGHDMVNISNCYTTAYVYNKADANLGHPMAMASSQYSFFITGRYFANASASLTRDSDNKVVSINFVGNLSTGYGSYGSNGIGSDMIVALAGVATSTSGIWSTAGAYPQLINNYGSPIE